MKPANVATNQPTVILMRVLPLLICLALAGCAGANAAHDLAPTGASGATAQASPDPGMQVQASASASAKRRAAAAPKSEATDKKEEWWKQGGVTREKISAMCWMKYEKGRKDLPLESRADLVNRCVAETLKEHPVR